MNTQLWKLCGLFLLVSFFNFSPSYSQEIEQSNTSKFKDQLLALENKYGVTFYYTEDWLNNLTAPKTVNAGNLNEQLQQLLKDTSLNFYFYDDKTVILTNGVAIYNELPDGFFIRSDSTTSTKPTTIKRYSNPIFVEEYREQTKSQFKRVTVGKTSKNASSNTAQLSGTVYNQNTNEPIPNLVVSVKGSNKKITTDQNGNYSLELPLGKNIITTRSLGIENATFEVLLFSTGTFNILLNEKVERLDEVTVEANIKKNVEEVSPGTTRVESEKSKNIPLVFGERDIFQVATTLPGISKAGEGAAGYNVRGGKTDQNLFLIDNAVLYNPSHFFGLFQALNPYTTKGVDIYKGNIPAQYGGRLSSVFDIKSITGNTQNFQGEASIGPVTGNIALQIPIKKEKSSLVVGARGTYSDWILRSLDDPQLNGSSANFFDVIAKYDHNFNENSNLSTSAYYSRDAFNITADSLFSYQNRIFNAKWNHKLGEKARGSLSAYNSDYRFEIDFEEDSNTDFILDYNVNETELKYHINHIISPKHKLQYGLSTKLYQVKPGTIAPQGSESQVETRAIPKEQGLESALYIGDLYKLNDKLEIDASARFSIFNSLGPATVREYLEGVPRSDESRIVNEEVGNNEIIETYVGPEFRISGRYLVTPTLSIKAGFNSGYQYIHSLSNNTTASPLDTWKLSDNNIKPQNGYQVSLGLFKNLKENQFEISLEGYYKRFDNALDFKTGADLLLNETIETEVLQGKGKAYGIEFLVKKNWGRLNGWLSYTYSRSLLQFQSTFPEEEINNGDFFPANFDKPHDISLVTNFKISQRFSFSGNFVYQTGRPITYPIGTYQFNNSEFVIYSERNEFRIPDFYRLDLSFNMEGNHKLNKPGHSFWTFSVYNVLGRNNPYSIFFVTDEGRVKALQSSIFAIPIPSITYNIKF
ncbi:TonB-dependent receptor [Spongiivirga sp. MCCC 1A20706]|uniref:TonB-dependent receptor n=1 Tax=Spongiivirga sp. MCCC 1A20706 TaxID=3160963 RepID=UPI0039773636